MGPDAPSREGSLADQVVVAGLDTGDDLAAIFGGVGVDVVAGGRSGVRLEGQLVIAPGDETAAHRQVADSHEYNRQAWNRQVEAGNRWTVGASPEEVDRARRGEVDILLTPQTFVPRDWFGELDGADVLCLASGGGQQGPILAAAGAHVTVFDATDAQLARDREVAKREGLTLRTVRGDMRDLSAFADASFDLIVHVQLFRRRDCPGVARGASGAAPPSSPASSRPATRSSSATPSPSNSARSSTPAWPSWASTKTPGARAIFRTRITMGSWPREPAKPHYRRFVMVSDTVLGGGSSWCLTPC